MVYPSTQRIHLINANTSVDEWVREAVAEFLSHKDALLAEQDIYSALESIASRFIASHPVLFGFNVYEVSKRLGEYLVSLLPRYSLVRISSVYGPSFTRGFIHRAIHPKAEGNIETLEKRDFIYIDDVNELLLRAALVQAADNIVFDAAVGDSQDLQKVWAMVRELMDDSALVTFKGDKAQEEMSPDPTFARSLLGREFTPMRIGLRKTIDWSLRVMREKEDNCPRCWSKPNVIVVDVGATYLRIGVMAPHGLLYEPKRVASPSKQSYPEDTHPKLQERLLETLAREIDIVRASHAGLALEEVGVSFGAVVTREGVVADASILWNDPSWGYDLKGALQERLPGARLTIPNDVSAATWRYAKEKRFCLITVSSGLSNKVFNAGLEAIDKLDLDAAGIGGEMEHVVVNPRAVDAVVQQAILKATTHPEEFRRSTLNTRVGGITQEINARHLGRAANEDGNFTLRLLEEADIPYCSCGNLADLCSYSSGRGALRRVRSLAAREDYGIASTDITDNWLQQAVATSHPLALQVLRDSTYPLALRILQLAADIGLSKFIIVGGFALKIGKEAYLQALEHHLVHLCLQSAFFRGWGEDEVRRLVVFGVDDDNDCLIGMGHFVQHLRSHYQAIEKPIGEQSLVATPRRIPRCGAREVIARILYSGICTTDLQILRGERGLEPIVLGHEGVCQVLEVGKDISSLDVGEIIVLNPNNPLDDHDKLGHTREGVFQKYVKFGREFLDRGQVLALGNSVISPTYTLIEPLSCVVAAQNRIKDRISGRNVLVVGAGLMDLLFVLTSTAMGARNVFLTNRSNERLNQAAAKGIVQKGKTFCMSQRASSQVDAASVGEGVDIVIICVSLGQGVQEAEAALGYVNTGGCVYLFAGFQPGDVLTLDGGRKLDAWSVRSGWKTEQVHMAGKPVDISGHRGSRQKDLVMAANLIRCDSLSFGRVISHIISLDALPECMLSLARDGSIQGTSASRVVVDMNAGHNLVEVVEALPLRHLREATRKRR